VICLVHALFRGRKAPANPWGAATMEWRTSSPPPPHNSDAPPPVEDPYDFSVLDYDPETNSYTFRADASQPAGAPAPGWQQEGEA